MKKMRNPIYEHVPFKGKCAPCPFGMAINSWENVVWLDKPHRRVHN